MMGDKIAKRSSLGNMVRKKLSDITNSMPVKLAADDSSVKKFVDRLVKEKMALMKHVQEKKCVGNDESSGSHVLVHHLGPKVENVNIDWPNMFGKIIELSGIEIQKLRCCLQKMQLQNWGLAQSNSHMLTELNLAKERLKEVHHELACKETLLKAKDLELKGREKIDLHAYDLQLQEEGDEMIAGGPGRDKDSEHCKTSRRRHPSRSRSLSSSVVPQPETEKEPVGSKRRYVRRKSTSSRTIHQEPSESLFEIDDAKFLVLRPSNAFPTKKEVTECTHGSKFYEEESQRTSVGRPVRKVVEKVQSYKEIPLNIKMRRSH